jgi:hypothetical protein
MNGVGRRWPSLCEIKGWRKVVETVVTHGVVSSIFCKKGFGYLLDLVVAGPMGKW